MEKTFELIDPQDVNSQEEAYEVQKSVIQAKSEGYTHVSEYCTVVDKTNVYTIDEAIEIFKVR